nr:MAG TPA: hypothetical protein [Caudoviricetes sp.]
MLYSNLIFTHHILGFRVLHHILYIQIRIFAFIYYIP